MDREGPRGSHRPRRNHNNNWTGMPLNEPQNRVGSSHPGRSGSRRVVARSRLFPGSHANSSSTGGPPSSPRVISQLLSQFAPRGNHTIRRPRREVSLRTSHNVPLRSAVLARRDRARVAELRAEIEAAWHEGLPPSYLEELEEMIADVRTNADRRELDLQELDAQRWERRQISDHCNIPPEPDWELSCQEHREIEQELAAEWEREREDQEAARLAERQAERRDALLDQLQALALNARTTPIVLASRRPLPPPARRMPPRPGQAIFDRLRRRLERALQENNQRDVQELTTSITDLRSHLREGLEAWDREYNRGAGHDTPSSPIEVDDSGEPDSDDFEHQVAGIIDRVIHPVAEPLPAPTQAVSQRRGELSGAPRTLGNGRLRDQPAANAAGNDTSAAEFEENDLEDPIAYWERRYGAAERAERRVFQQIALTAEALELWLPQDEEGTIPVDEGMEDDRHRWLIQDHDAALARGNSQEAATFQDHIQPVQATRQARRQAERPTLTPRSRMRQAHLTEAPGAPALTLPHPVQMQAEDLVDGEIIEVSMLARSRENLLPAADTRSSSGPASTPLAGGDTEDWAQALSFQPSMAPRNQPRRRRPGTPYPPSSRARTQGTSSNVRSSTPHRQRTLPNFEPGQGSSSRSSGQMTQPERLSRSTSVQTPQPNLHPRDPVTGRFLPRRRTLFSPLRNTEVRMRSRSPPFSEAEAERPTSSRRTRD
ncbi:MAG: hypothetical protein M1836_001716 [Candelina mexicana]|nr:MAG: hypothetical protein M1836_001716 [Candelina mexicana]